MRATRSIVLAASLVVASSPGWAYSTIYSFGDSLSDVGNVYSATGGLVPIPPYYNGRFSNGPNWVDDLSAKLGLGTVSPSAAGGNDFAVGGAQTGATLANPTAVPLVDLNYQVQEFAVLKPSPEQGALYTLDIGANDIGNALSDYAGGTLTEAGLQTFLTEAIGNTVDAVSDLFGDGARSLLYYEVPDLAVVPAFSAAGALASQLSMEFNEGVLNGLKPLEAEGLTVFDLPVYSDIEDIVADPAKYGLSNVTGSCFSGNYDTPGAECATPDQYLFWDTEHPTAAGHAITAQIAFNLLTDSGGGDGGIPAAPEAPVWEMLLTGFLGFGLVNWRMRRREALRSFRR